MTDCEQTSSPNIVLIILDTARRDVYNEEATQITEKVDTTFTQMRSVSNWSIPSHASMLTGLLPSEHGVNTHQRDFSNVEGSSSSSTLRETLDGYTLLGASSNFFCSSEYNFNYFFDEFVDVPNCGAFSTNGVVPREIESDRSGVRKYADYLKAAASSDDSAASLWNLGVTQLTKTGLLSLEHEGDNGSARALQQGLNLIKAVQDRPWFLFINLMDVHDPHYYHEGLDEEKYDLDVEWSSDGIDAEKVLQDRESFNRDIDSFRNYYRANMDYLDRKVADFVGKVQQESNEEVTFVITSDHGENLGGEADDRMFGHTSSLSEGVLHIPFDIINPPDEWPKEVTDLVSNQSLIHILEAISNKTGQLDGLTEKPTLAEVVGNTPPVFETNISWWDRAIRAEYKRERGTKITWDSLNNVTEYSSIRERPNFQVETDSSAQLAEVETEEVWKRTIIDMKRNAMDLTEDTSKEDNYAVSRLESLGYI